MKAISPIVASVLLILLTISSIAILYPFVKNINQKLLFSPEMSCIDLQTKPPTTINSACYDSQNNQLKVNLEFSSQIQSIDFLVTINGNTETYTCGEECKNCILPKIGQKTFYFNTKKPELVKISINNCVVDKKIVENCG